MNNLTFSFDIFLDYVRMFSYAVVILTSLMGIKKRRFNGILFLGDILLSTALLFTLVANNFLSADVKVSADLFITPVAVLWAIIHYVSLLKGEFKGGTIL